MLGIKKLENKIRVALMKRLLQREYHKLYLRTNFKEYYKVEGQKYNLEDPFGEENWD